MRRSECVPPAAERGGPMPRDQLKTTSETKKNMAPMRLYLTRLICKLKY